MNTPRALPSLAVSNFRRRLGGAAGALLLAVASACSVTGQPELLPGEAGQPVVPLWPEGVPVVRTVLGAERVVTGRVTEVQEPRLTVYAPPAGQANGTAVVVCPGGGYNVLAMGHEGIDVARWFNTQGVTAFVLRYRLADHGHPAPLQDVARAIRTVRSRATEWGVQPDRIGIIGFSAGGHVTATAVTRFDAPEAKTGAALDAVSARPDFGLLIYPVVTLLAPHAHQGSRKALLGPLATDDVMAASWSAERHITSQTPPAFIVFAQDDKTVPVENGLMLYAALREAGVSAELHVFPRGGHGFGLRPKFEGAYDWPALAADWMRRGGWLPMR